MHRVLQACSFYPMIHISVQSSSRVGHALLLVVLVLPQNFSLSRVYQDPQESQVKARPDLASGTFWKPHSMKTLRFCNLEEKTGNLQVPSWNGVTHVQQGLINSWTRSLCLSVHSTASHLVLGLLNGWEVSVVGALLPEMAGELWVWVCGLSFEGAGPPGSP